MTPAVERYFVLLKAWLASGRPDETYDALDDAWWAMDREAQKAADAVLAAEDPVHP